MSPEQTYSSNRSFPLIICAFVVVAVLSACKPEGLINKVKYNDVKYVNTCETFTTEINKLIQDNNMASRLQVSKYDNSDFTYFYLEPGQIEIKKDTLFIRLNKDLEYGKYLDKGVAVHVNASYQASDKVKDLEKNQGGEIGTLVVNREYYVAHRKPFFMYTFPLNGKELEGKQLMLSFAIAKYKKDGSLKNYFCETDAQPIGTALPACCTADTWAATDLQSVIGMPKIDVQDEAFRYKGFEGTIDVLFDESSAKLSYDSSYSALVIQAFVEKYKNLGYRIQDLDLTGWASPGGREKYNIKLSQQRADALRKSLEILNGDIEGLDISAEGKGEDWERVKLLTRASSLAAEQKAEVIAIADDASLTNDQKEAKLRKVSYWNTLVPEVLVKARHTFTVMDFDYNGKAKTLKRFDKRLPVASQELEGIAKKVFNVSGYSEGKNADMEMATINEVLTKTASPNLYAMRATYHMANQDYEKAFEDLEKASMFRDANSSKYSQAIQGYKVLFADEYDMEKNKQLLVAYNDLADKNPGDRTLFFNRAILMDKIGYLSGALTEYENLLQGNTVTAANYTNRGVARLKTNMVSEAQADFLAAVAADQKQAEAYFNLAVVSAYQGLTQKTMEYLDKAVQLNPDYKDFIFDNPAFSVMSEDPKFEKYRN